MRGPAVEGVGHCPPPPLPAGAIRTWTALHMRRRAGDGDDGPQASAALVSRGMTVPPPPPEGPCPQGLGAVDGSVPKLQICAPTLASPGGGGGCLTKWHSRAAGCEAVASATARVEGVGPGDPSLCLSPCPPPPRGVGGT